MLAIFDVKICSIIALQTITEKLHFNFVLHAKIKMDLANSKHVYFYHIEFSASLLFQFFWY